jgi:predicted HTH transcriptional regulator
MAEYLSLSIKAIEKNIKILKAQNIIRREGPDKGGYWVIVDK